MGIVRAEVAELEAVDDAVVIEVLIGDTATADAGAVFGVIIRAEVLDFGCMACAVDAELVSVACFGDVFAFDAFLDTGAFADLGFVIGALGFCDFSACGVDDVLIFVEFFSAREVAAGLVIDDAVAARNKNVGFALVDEGIIARGYAFAVLADIEAAVFDIVIGAVPGTRCIGIIGLIGRIGFILNASEDVIVAAEEELAFVGAFVAIFNCGRLI